MVRLAVDSEEYKFSIELERRITFLRGDSGVGKSALVDMISISFSDDGIVNVDCDKKIAILSNGDEPSRISSEPNRLFILDDLLISEDAHWMRSTLMRDLIKNDSYLLIINRVDPGTLGTNLEYSMKSIFEMRTSGVKHWCVPVFEHCKYSCCYK